MAARDILICPSRNYQTLRIVYIDIAPAQITTCLLIFFLPLAPNHQCSRYVADFLPSSFHSYPFRMGHFICNGLLSRFSDCCLLLVQSLLPLATPLVTEFCSACRSAQGHEHNNETPVGLYIYINGIS